MIFVTILETIKRKKMKVKASVKKICSACKTIRRKGRV
jgi:hypothetical protein